ncbi:MAG: SDR family NAD(P)-dependent oxidoreductase [Pseudomonadales bacterium]
MQHLKGKVVVITGGGSGMGREAARLCSAAGARVALLDVDERGMSETLALGQRMHAYPVDITDFEALRFVIDTIESGLGPIYRLYNAAAIMPLGRLLDQNNAVSKKIMDVNYGGLLNIAQAALPAMVERGEGEFISFASMAGLIPTMLTGAYSASKAATAFLTEILYHENIDTGVKFVCVCPPTVDTPLLQQGRDTEWPKMLESGDDPIKPIAVIEAIDQHLERGEFWVYVGKGGRTGPRMRRFFPNMIWKHNHKMEGF